MKIRYNKGAHYRGRVLKWDTVIEQKASELSNFLVGKAKVLSFEEPAPVLETCDDRDLRNRILGLTQQSARELGIGKSTLHYLRKNVSNGNPFKVYSKVRARLEKSEMLTKTVSDLGVAQFTAIFRKI